MVLILVDSRYWYGFQKVIDWDAEMAVCPNT